MTFFDAVSRASLIAALAAAAPAFAQETPTNVAPAATTADTEQTGGIEDIVVTAQRREQSLQRVPIAVTAISGAAIANAGATSSLDISTISPGLQMNVSRNTVTPYLRGVGTQNSGVGEEGSIATYVDGVYITALSAASFALNNIARVEVLKGPQGTLFGRNATGGLIHVITKDPSHTLTVVGNAGYANYDTLSGNVYATTGLSDTMAIDFAGYYAHQGDGWGHNLRTGEDINYNREWAVRSKLLFEPTDRLTLRLSGDYAHRNNDIGNSRSILSGARVTGNFPRVGSIYDTIGNVPRDVENNQRGVSLKADYDLGGPKLTSTTAYRYTYNYTAFDQDSGPLTVITALLTERTKSFQQEFLLVGDIGSFDYTAGLFYFHSNGKFDPISLRSALIPSQNIDRFSTQITDSYAAFAQGTYHLGATSVTGGIRYTIDKRDLSAFDQAFTGNTVPSGTVIRTTATNPFANKRTYKKPTWRLAIDHQFTPQVLAYASFSRGFKSGVFNLTNPYQAAVAPETLDAYEVGVKSDLIGRTLRLNASGFYYDYKNIQLSRISGGVTQLLNAATAEIYGLDLEAIAAPPVPTGDLQFRGAVSYLHGRYTDFPGAPITTRNPVGGNLQVAGDASGNHTRLTPTYTVSATVDYSVPIGGLKAGFNVTNYFNGGFFWDPDNRVKQEAYNLINASVRIAQIDDRWRVSAFINNALDRRYYNQVSTGSLGDQGSPGAPRTYGVSLGFKFGG